MSTTMIHVKDKHHQDAPNRLAEMLGGVEGVSAVTTRKAGILLVEFDAGVIPLRDLLDRSSGSGYPVEFVDL